MPQVDTILPSREWAPLDLRDVTREFDLTAYSVSVDALYFHLDRVRRMMATALQRQKSRDTLATLGTACSGSAPFAITAPPLSRSFHVDAKNTRMTLCLLLSVGRALPFVVHVQPAVWTLILCSEWRKGSRVDSQRRV